MKGDNNRTLEKLKGLILKIADFEEVNKVLAEALKSGMDPVDIVDTLSGALEEVGKKYESGEYFLSELIMAGHLATQITDILKPHLVKTKMKTAGKVVFGTVKGDVHDIGKNIVIMMLQTAGFEVIDLGVDVPTEKFVEAITNEKPDVMCMSALLTSTMNEMENVIDVLKENGLKDKVKVVVGGRPTSEKFADEIGADGYAGDAVKAVKVVKELIGRKGGVSL